MMPPVEVPDMFAIALRRKLKMVLFIFLGFAALC